MGNQGNDTQELNKRHQAFAEFVAGGATATDAYLAAGYSGAKRETLHRNASRLRRDPRIRAAIRNLRYEGDMIAREDCVLDVARKLTYLARLVTTGAGGLKEDDELVQYSRTFKDGSTATRLPCKLKALQLHSRLAGHFDPKPEDLAPPKEPEKSFDEELQELYDEIRAGRGANRGERRMEGPAPDIDHSSTNDPQGTLSGCQICSGRRRNPVDHKGRVENPFPTQMAPGPAGRILEEEKPSSPDGRAGFSEPADFTSGTREATSRVPEGETPPPSENFPLNTSAGSAQDSLFAGTAFRGVRGRERSKTEHSADVASTSATPSHEGNTQNQNSKPHPTTSIVHEGRARLSEPADLTSGLQGRVPSSLPQPKIRTPQSNFAPQPFPYPGHDFPELYGPKVRLIR